MQVKIARFKSQLSAYLSRVRAGESLVVTDRNTPIARLVPYAVPAGRLAIRRARSSPRELKRLSVRPAHRSSSLKALMADRDEGGF